MSTENRASKKQKGISLAAKGGFSPAAPPKSETSRKNRVDED